MGGEGSMSAMISSLKNNRNLLKQKRNPFNKDKLGGNETHPYKKPLRFNHISKVKLVRMKRQLQQRKVEENRKIVLVLAVSIIIALGIIAVIARNIS